MRLVSAQTVFATASTSGRPPCGHVAAACVGSRRPSGACTGPRVSCRANAPARGRCYGRHSQWQRPPPALPPLPLLQCLHSSLPFACHSALLVSTPGPSSPSAAVLKAPPACRHLRRTGGSAPRRHADCLPPPRVTNERREMRDPAVLRPDDDEYITVDPDNPVPDPHVSVALETGAWGGGGFS